MADSRHALLLRQARQRFGFVPNLVHEACRSLVALEVYLAGLEGLHDGRLTTLEQRVAMLAVSVWHGSHYGCAMHTQAALRGGADRADLAAISQRQPPRNLRLRAITQATWALLDKQGRLDGADLAGLTRTGIEHAQLYEIIAIVGSTLIADYIDNLRALPLDDPLAPP